MFLCVTQKTNHPAALQLAWCPGSLNHGATEGM